MNAEDLSMRPARAQEIHELVEFLGARVPECAPQTVWELPWQWHTYTVVEGPGGEIVATGSLQPLPHGKAEIRGLAVAPGWRGRGLASRVARHLIQRARQLGVDAVCVTRKPEFFRRFGFRDTFPAWLRLPQRAQPPSPARPPRTAMEIRV